MKVEIFFCEYALYGDAAGGIMIPMGKCQKKQHQTPFRCESNGKHCRFYKPDVTAFVEVDSAEVINVQLEHEMELANWRMNNEVKI